MGLEIAFAFVRNAGVDFMERMSKRRLRQTVGPVKEMEHSLKICLFVDGTQRLWTASGLVGWLVD